MKINQLFAICGIAAALMWGANQVSAQPTGGGGFGGGGRRFDPQQMQKDYLDFVRNYLGFTNDEDWSAVQPLVQKVMDAQREEMSGMGNGMRMMFEARRAQRDGGNQNGDDQNRRRFRGGGFFGQPSPEYTALQNAIDNNAPAAQIKELLDKYNAAEKVKRDNLKAARDNLRAVLTVKQEGQATLLGLLD